MRTTKWVGGGFLILAAVLAWGVVGQDRAGPSSDASPESEAAGSVWMKQKLSHSEGILEGLTRGNLDLVSKHATAMKALNKIEYFVRREPAGYRTQLHQFQFAIDELVRTAQAGNLDGATLAFTQMTVSCVNCHKQLRSP
ncbi:MAG: hypothetical protein AB7O38_05465 [Pirellulaceae bacterium]